MSSPIRVARDTPPSITPVSAQTMRVTQELPLVSVELGRALLDEQAKLRCEVLLWQQWVRYLAIAVLVLLSITLTSAVSRAIVPLTILAVGYVTVVALTSWILRRSPSTFAKRSFPHLLTGTDIAALAGFVYLTSTPQQLFRILLIGFLSMQLGVFYFGRVHGALAAVLTLGAYLTFTLAVSPFVPGPPVSGVSVAFSAVVFALISFVLIYTFGSFRERMDSLRMYCKIVEQGEAASLPELGHERWPDELTLLARSFQSMHARLAEQIGSDPLTGCMNRRALETRLRADLRHARRRASTVGVAIVDVDHFKEINDSEGHQVGDMVLQQIATIMMQTARDTDAVARFGGDEFVIVLPDTGWQGALTFAERMRRRVENFTFGPSGASMQCTVSIGVALGRGGDPISSDMLLKEADTALYKAKAGGRNRVFS